MNPSSQQLRTLLRDQAKLVWTNDELEDMLNHGLSWWNLVSPETCLDLIELRNGTPLNQETQQSAVLWAAVVLALTHLLHPSGLKERALEPEERACYEEMLSTAEEMFETSKRTKSRLVSRALPTWTMAAPPTA